MFGFNRLSIIDIEHSHQPLRWGPPDNPDRYALTFNGEIYNYLELRAELAQQHGAVFRTEGDGEAIVAAFHHWGAEAVRRLRGMFAFAIWDTQTRSLFLARDPFGIKPLYTCDRPRGIAFGSEKKALLAFLGRLALSDDLDPRALAHYVALQYVPEPETLHRDIRRLGSGMLRDAPGRGPVVTALLRADVPAAPVAEGAAAGATERSRPHCARAWPSTCAPTSRSARFCPAASTRRPSRRWRCGTTRSSSPSPPASSGRATPRSTSPPSRRRRSARATSSRWSPPPSWRTAIPEIVWYLDDPVADPALVPLYFVAREARKHVKVVLSGEGADELFGGYTIYREPLSLRPFETLPGTLRRPRGECPTDPGGHAREEPVAPRVDDARRALLRQRPQLQRRDNCAVLREFRRRSGA